jgi:TadE-like protein
MRSKQRSQAIVEFGLIAILFVGLMFATVDFGLLLNTWLSVSSGTREIARNASVGKNAVFLQDEASKLNMPSVSASGFSKFCCDASSAVEVQVEYFMGSQTTPAPPCAPGCTPCPPWTAGCTPIPPGSINTNYPAGDLGTVGSCGVGPACRPLSDDMVLVTIVAHGAQIITPLLRPIFGCTNGSNPNCNVPLTSRAIVRYEGAEF